MLIQSNAILVLSVLPAAELSISDLHQKVLPIKIQEIFIEKLIIDIYVESCFFFPFQGF